MSPRASEVEADQQCGGEGAQRELQQANGWVRVNAVDPGAQGAPIHAVLGVPLGERLLRRAPVCEQLGGFGLGDAARARWDGELRPARSRVVGRGGAPA